MKQEDTTAFELRKKYIIWTKLVEVEVTNLASTKKERESAQMITEQKQGDDIQGKLQ